MKGFRYIEDAPTIAVDAARCTGCGMCERVCPHGVLRVEERVVRLVDGGACIECGACVTNCEAGALSVDAGVGCAAAIIAGWFGRSAKASCG